MTTRISTYAADQYNTQLVLQLKQQLNDLLTQVTSGKKSTNYEGISQQAQQAIDLGDQTSSVGNYLTNNTLVGIKLNAMQSVYSSVNTTMQNFQQELQNFINNGSQMTPENIQSLQQQAFQSMQDMEYYLNTQVDGQYIFSGTATSTPPVDVGFNSLSQFQNAYDGYTTSYGTTSSADLTQAQTAVTNTGSITFNSANDTLTAANAGGFGDLPVGSPITLSGTGPAVGTFTVLANDGTTVQIGPNLVAEGDPNNPIPAPPTVTLTTSANSATDPSLNLSQQVYFSPPGVISSMTAGAFANVLPAGTSFTVSGAANAANNGNFVVASNDGTNIVIQRPDLTSQATLTQATGDRTASVTTSFGTGAVSFADQTLGNGLTFNAANSTISDPSGIANLSLIPVGSYVTVANATNATNNGTYLVTANNAGVISVRSSTTTSLMNEAANTNAVISNGTATGFSPGSLAFAQGDSVVTAANSGSLDGIDVGQTINVTGTALNNGAFTVTQTFTTPVANEIANSTYNPPPEFTTTDAATGATTTASTNYPIQFTAGTPGTVTGNPVDMMGLKVGDVVNVANTKLNGGSFVVTANTLNQFTAGSGGGASTIIDGATTIAHATTGALTFAANGSTIIGAVTGGLSGVAAGDLITVAGSTINNGTRLVTQTFPTAVANETTAAGAATVTVNDLTKITPAGELKFTAGASPTLAGNAQDLGGIVAGDVITMSGTASNNSSFVVNSITPNLLTNETSTVANEATVDDTTAAVSVTAGAGKQTQFFASSGIILAGGSNSMAGMNDGDSISITNSLSNNTATPRTVTETFNAAITDEASNAQATITDGTAQLTNAQTGGVTFTASSNTMTAATVGGFNTIHVGDVITVAGSANNNNSYVVTGNDGTTLTLAPPGKAIRVSDTTLNLAPPNTAVRTADDTVTFAAPNTAVQVAKNVSLSKTSYYAGNSGTLNQEIDNNTQFAYGVTASDPAFEKAFRAMALIAEGVTGTAGGLDMNADRLQQANYLITSAIDNSSSGTPPFGPEQASNLGALTSQLDLQQSTLASTTTQQTNYQNFLQTGVGSIINSDLTATITEMLNQQAALQASYQSLASVQQLSLLNYLK
jgi:hypothetical protein